jgi:carbon storage regulator
MNAFPMGFIGEPQCRFWITLKNKVIHGNGISVMLILSRRESERVYLGEDIVLTIVRVNGDKVRIGVEAPSNVKILRTELEISSSETRSLPKARGSDTPASVQRRAA